MENITPLSLQEIIFASSVPAISKRIASLEKKGVIRKIAPRIYSSNLKEHPAIIIRRNIFHILGRLYPNAVLSHRSAFELQPTSQGALYLTYSYTKKISLPGITLCLLQGPKPGIADTLLSGKLYTASWQRALLENLQVTRQKGPSSKTLELQVLETRLEQLLKVKGKDYLLEIKEQARSLAMQWKMEKEYERLNSIINNLLAPVSKKALSSPLALARALGKPYDAERLFLMEKLFVELKQYPFRSHKERNNSLGSFTNLAFFETYFSIHTDGSPVSVEEAKTIIETNTHFPHLRKDSSCILGCYHLSSNRNAMMQTPHSPEDLLEILKNRFQLLNPEMAGNAGAQFRKNNQTQAGGQILEHELIEGTLLKGYDYYQSLTEPFARAVYLLFLISELQPFEDCNGVIARLMMNAELVKMQQSKIIIPAVIKLEYQQSITRLQKLKDPRAFINLLLHAWDFTASKCDENLDQLQKTMERAHAFQEAGKYKLKV